MSEHTATTTPVPLLQRVQRAEHGVNEVQNDVAEIRGDVAEVRAAVSQVDTKVALLQLTVEKRCNTLEKQIKMRFRWGDVGKAAGTFLGGVLVVVLPTHADQIGQLVQRVLSVMP